ncbi:MAG: NADH-quinone oxidoreductase subunit J [Bdellovibrio sp.]|nr:NADH-quinone oxidoreductase subunit J [Bdellovibrio sp.]
MEISPLFFYLFAGIAIAFSLFVVFSKSPISSAFSLIVVFFCFAAIYALLEAHLIAALQILVYAGAIMVLFIFVIMLLGADKEVLDFKKSSVFLKCSAVLFCGIGVCGFAWVLFHSPILIGTGPHSLEKIKMVGGNTRAISELLFSEYVLPFELTSILLLVGIVGCVVLVKRKSL